MYKRIRQRLDGSSEQGFTLIELLVVIIIIGILLAIAVPSYLGFRDRANNSAAKANIRAALPAAEAYFADAVADGGGGGSYVGMTWAKLNAIDSGISGSLTVASVAAGPPSTYCLAESVGGKNWSVAGPGASATDYKPNLTCA